VGALTAPGPQEKRFAAYMDGLAEAAGHADRNLPLKNYCTGLLLPGERKSVEPMAARLAPDSVRRMHQSLHHVVADAPWDDEAVLDRCLDFVLPAMLRHEPVVAWVVDDTGFPKKGRESVGVARQYCGQVGKQDNCRVAVSRAITTEKTSMPVAFRLYLPEAWIRTASGGKRPAYRSPSSSKPNQRLRWNRFGARATEAFRRAWCWPTPVMATTRISAAR
jgi:SRSO17 transposase